MHSPPPPRPRGPRHRTSGGARPCLPRHSRTGSLLAGAGPGLAAPVTMVSDCGGSRRGSGQGARWAGSLSERVHPWDGGRTRGSAPRPPPPRSEPLKYGVRTDTRGQVAPPVPRGRAAEEVQLGPESPPPACPPQLALGAASTALGGRPRRKQGQGGCSAMGRLLFVK